MALPRLVDAKTVIDLGSGIALLAALLAARRPATRVTAVEWDETKVAAARLLAQGLPGIEVVQGDARTARLPPSDAIVLFDILHYNDVDTQREWLKRCAAAVRPGGNLLVRELDGRGTFADILERLAVCLGFNRGDGVHPRLTSEIGADLEALGFRVESFPCGRGLFRANALLVATRIATSKSS
jgi:SAM-dependent methyltransferase